MALFEENLLDVLTYYKRMLGMFNSIVDGSPEGSLLCQKRRDNTLQFLHSFLKDGKRIRKGINSDEFVQRELARKRFAEMSADILQDDIDKLEALIHNMTPYDPNAILKNMPAGYKNLPEEYFFDRDELSIDLNLEGADEARARRYAEWGDSDYEQSTYYAENKKMRTSNR